MKTIKILIISTLPIFAIEGIPSYDDILNETKTDITIPSFEIEAPKVQGSLQGLPDLKVELSPEDIRETVQANQGRLTNTFKSYLMQKDNTIGRLYDLTLTISKDGSVSKAIVKGPKNKEFIQDVTKIILTWSFEKTTKDKNVTLRNLDFMYRTELSME